VSILITRRFPKNVSDILAANCDTQVTMEIFSFFLYTFHKAMKSVCFLVVFSTSKQMTLQKAGHYLGEKGNDIQSKTMILPAM